MNLPRSDWPTKITSRRHLRIIQETKERRTTSEQLQASLALVKVSVHDSIMRKRRGKNDVREATPVKTGGPCSRGYNPPPSGCKFDFRTKKNSKLFSHLSGDILMILKTLGKIFGGQI